MGPPEAAAGDPRVARPRAGRSATSTTSVPDGAAAAARRCGRRGRGAADRRDRPRGLASSRRSCSSSCRDFQITIPELGTIAARRAPPIVVLTSNRTRELHDALKRRCLYHWIAFPDAERERRDHRGAGARARRRTRRRRWSRRSSAVRGAAADQAARHRRDDRVGAGARRLLADGGQRRGRWRCGARSACCSRSRRTPSASPRSTWAADADAAAGARAPARVPPRARRRRRRDRAAEAGGLPRRARRVAAARTSSRSTGCARVTLSRQRRGRRALRRGVRHVLPRRRCSCTRSRPTRPRSEGEPPRRRARTSEPQPTRSTEGTGSGLHASPADLANGVRLRSRHARGARRARRPRAGRWTTHLPQVAARRSERARRGARLDLRRVLRRRHPHGRRDHRARAARAAARGRGALLRADRRLRLAARAQPGLAALRARAGPRDRPRRDVHVRDAAHARHARSSTCRDVDAALDGALRDASWTPTAGRGSAPRCTQFLANAALRRLARAARSTIVSPTGSSAAIRR